MVQWRDLNAILDTFRVGECLTQTLTVYVNPPGRVRIPLKEKTHQFGEHDRVDENIVSRHGETEGVLAESFE